jgi:hypothetical protein
MPTDDKTRLFVSFCVKVLQILSTETESSGNKCIRILYNIFTSLAVKKVDEKMLLGVIFKNAATSILTSKADTIVFEKVRNLFTKSHLRANESQSLMEQGSGFKMMREDIKRYIAFLQTVLMPLFSSSGLSTSSSFVSVAPMLVCILLSSLSNKKGGVMDPMTQIGTIIGIAKLGSMENIRTKLNRLTAAHRQFQASIPADSTQSPPDLIGEMITSVKSDVDSSTTYSLGTSGLDIKIKTITAMMDLVK